MIDNADALIDQARSEGFDIVAQGTDLSAELIERLQWILAESYLVGDSGGADLSTTMFLSNGKAQRLSHVEPSTQSAIRVVHADKAVAVLRWTSDDEGDAVMQCSGALFLEDTFYPPATSGKFGDYRLQQIDLGIPDTAASFSSFQLDRDAIRAELQQATPPHFIMGVQIRYNLEGLK